MLEKTDDEKRKSGMTMNNELTGVTFEEGTAMSLGFDPVAVNESTDDIKSKLRKDYKNGK